MEKLQEKENFLTKRKEVKVVIERDKNPSYEEAKQIISDEFKSDKERIIIKKVKGKFGRDTFLISAFIYDSKEDRERFEGKEKQEESKEKKESSEGSEESKVKENQEQKPAGENKQQEEKPEEKETQAEEKIN